MNQPVTLANIDEKDRDRVLEIINRIDLNSSTELIQYGLKAQMQLSEFTDKILNQIKTKDSGYAGTLLENLVETIKSTGITEVKEDNFLAKIPLIGSLFSSLKAFVQRYEKVSTKIDKIVEELENAKIDLLRWLESLDKMYEKNSEYIKELDFYILAGEERIKEIKEKILPSLQQEALSSNDPLIAQKYKDIEQALNTFEKRVHDLKLSRTSAIQTAPQIRLIQKNEHDLVDKIQSILVNTIPLWKRQIVLAIAIYKNKQVANMSKAVSDMTNELLVKNSEMLKQSSIEVAKENERGIIDVETLKKVNADLIQSVEEIIKIQKESKAKREVIEAELVKIENELKDRLLSAAS